MQMTTFNNFKKISLLLTVLTLYSSFAAANSINVVSDKGTITLKIVNRPPVITNVHLSPDTAFEDTRLECIPIINDENPAEVKLAYRWYVGNVLVETNSNELTGFKAEDLVKCEITPTDNENVSGETKNASIFINKKPALSSITSFVIKSYNAKFLSVFNFLF